MTLNLATIVRSSARKYPTRPAIHVGEATMDHATLHARAQRFAGALAKLGIARGEHVALMLPNVPHFPIAYFGAHYAANPVVPLNVLLMADEIAYHLEDSAAAALVVWEGFYEQARAGFDRIAGCR